MVAKSTIATLALVSDEIAYCHPGICDAQILFPTTLNLLHFLDIATKMGLLRRFWGVAQRAFSGSEGY